MEFVAKHNKDAVYAAKQYAKAKPWKGTFAERVTKIRQFHADLLDAYEMDVDLVIDADGDSPPANANGFVSFDGPGGTVIILRPAFAVLTYLRLFAEVLEYDRDLKYTGSKEGIAGYSARWANGLFKKAFPKSWAKLVERNAPILTRDYA
jgi:hypothetical protein